MRSSGRRGRSATSARRQKASTSDRPREFYVCPRCEGGFVNFIGRDVQDKEVFRCSSCGADVGVATLEAAQRARQRRD